MGLVCATIVLFGLIDTATTLTWIGLGVAREANPLMAWVMGYGDLAFIATKMAITVASCLTFYHFRALRFARVSAWVLLFLMGVLVLYQTWSPLFVLGLI